MKARAMAATAALCSLALLAVFAGSAAAQPYDHLKCFKIKDERTFKKATADLDDVLSGVLAGCTIRSRAKEFCVPVEKHVISIEDGVDQPLPAQDHQFDRLCYKVKCPSPSASTLSLQDQFGSRQFEKLKVATICTPAVKGPAPTTTTTTTTSTTSTTTTQPPILCGDASLDPSEECEANADCSIGESCTGCCTCTDSQCPSVLEITSHAGTGAISTVTEIDEGWTGWAHDLDRVDEAIFGVEICSSAGAGPSSCGESVVGGVAGGLGNCRCNTNNRLSCTNPFQLDAASCTVGVACTTNDDCRVCSVSTSIPCLLNDDCPTGETCSGGVDQGTCVAGQCVGRCDCYLAPPEPVATVNTPICIERKLTGDVTGTWNVDTGEGTLLVPQRHIMYLGESLTAPCPTCDGDITPNDGVRDGVCILGANAGMSCDANSSDPTLPAPSGGAYSYDCAPVLGKNVSGPGHIRTHELTTGTRSLSTSPGVECGFTFSPETCPCGVCGDDPQVPCSSNADCASCTTNSDCLAAGSGVCDASGRCACGRQAQGQPRPNQCDDGLCSAMGEDNADCTTGPDLSFCDGVLRANGEPYVTCLSNADCGTVSCGPVSCGSCTLTRRLQCFGATIGATGTPDPTDPVLAATFCSAPSNKFSFNAVLGLPGPVRKIVQTSTVLRCAGDAGSTYPGCP